jgi:hypothetical protein
MHNGSKPMISHDESVGRGDAADTPDGERPGFEKGRDLTLLALAIVVAVEGAFALYTVMAGAEGRLVLSAGRFALIAGLAYMTWQGFAFPRWILVVLVGFAVFGGPIALRMAASEGTTLQLLLLTVSVAGYAVTGWLLAFSAPVREFLSQRRRDLDHDRVPG